METFFRCAQRGLPLACLLAVLAGCATAAQHQAQQAGTATREAFAQLKACVVPIIDKPVYAQLLAHTPDLDTGQPTMAQLTDETIPSVEDARLVAARFDDLRPCRAGLLITLSAVRPDAFPIFGRAFANGAATTALIVERKITWAESARRTQENMGSLREQAASADKQWIADLNTSNQAELAQRQAASNALMQWSQQQQLINAVNRPVQTNCMHTGSFTNCTSY